MLSMKSRMMKYLHLQTLVGGGKNENEILLDLKLNFLIIDSVDELVDYFPSLVSFLKNFFILHMRKILCLPMWWLQSSGLVLEYTFLLGATLRDFFLPEVTLYELCKKKW